MAMGGKAGEVFTEINVTPLTDVFLVLLVIMILIAPLVNQAVLKVDPPGQSSKTDKPPEKEVKIDCDVLKTGEIKINGKVVQADTMAVMTAIKAIQQEAGKNDLPLILNSDEDALQKYVVAVMDGAAGCNIKKMSIMPPRK
ncbi:MAG: biopolymer transporter ExbD [Candidatus Obscuribacter sp.]|jgi:biopolymer transport protein ExbD|nr:biopolymer transporter ExbD [Candidatus Obscuribacter sp.]MBK7840248.1 biopolymer transporter ExbD [Candidatus Obscuribacter sp.]MBK9622201.1 biopolymer transporter ExbD [Candidatus Obscuribacter sp.]MBK9771013.1 biopolymer transporter ExbD [Candidatus Obscuribacter sp.]MBL0186549.1 biopolymer transporter ExbD [Candidatus Obscuribacter sp.]